MNRPTAFLIGLFLIVIVCFPPLLEPGPNISLGCWLGLAGIVSLFYGMFGRLGLIGVALMGGSWLIWFVVGNLIIALHGGK
jgi:hypothetical protein